MTHLLPFLPELLMLGACFAVLGVDMARPGGASRAGAPGASFHVAWAGLALVLAALVFLPGGIGSGGARLGGYAATAQAGLWKQIFAAAALATVLLSRPYFLAGGSARGMLTRPGAYYGLLALCTSGMFALVSARDLLTFYLGLELATLPLYALAAFQPGDSGSAEAGAKYILFGGLSSALSLFGLSFLYGAAGGLGLDALAQAAEAAPDDALLLAGTCFLLGGLGFKLSMAPLHMWAPDVYEGAPTPVMAFLSVGSKAAAVGALAALFFGPLDPLRGRLDAFFAAAAVLTMTVGNLGAMRQRGLRRFIAYSSIAQAGYMLVALAGDGAAARAALLFNLAVYGATGFALYFVMSLVGRARPETLDSLRGLSRRSPGLAALLALSMFSLAGIPPLAGFLGKFLIFSSAAREGEYALVVAALANAVASFYYYMRPVKEAYLAEPGAPEAPLRLSAGEKAWGWILGALLLLLGTTPFLVDNFAR